jgi:hypothetical protein
MEHVALEGAGVLHADHHLGEQVLEHARRREVVGRADLAHVGHHRVARLGAVDGEAGIRGLGEGEQVVAHPGHRQVGEDIVVGPSLSNSQPLCAAAMKAPWVWQTPFGLPVVPEV